MKRFASLVAVCLLALSPAWAGSPIAWKPDKVHSEVRFAVSHLVISEVTGRFKDFDATVLQNGDDFSNAVVDASIKTGSVETGNETRDKHLKSDDFLNAEKFPEIRFKSTGFEKTGDGTYQITGNLTIRDVTKPVVLSAKFNGVLKDPWGGTRAGFKATTTINRFDYGVRWDKTVETGGLIAGKDVEITLLLELVKQP